MELFLLSYLNACLDLFHLVISSLTRLNKLSLIQFNNDLLESQEFSEPGGPPSGSSREENMTLAARPPRTIAGSNHPVTTVSAAASVKNLAAQADMQAPCVVLQLATAAGTPAPAVTAPKT